MVDVLQLVERVVSIAVGQPIGDNSRRAPEHIASLLVKQRRIREDSDIASPLEITPVHVDCPGQFGWIQLSR